MFVPPSYICIISHEIAQRNIWIKNTQEKLHYAIDMSKYNGVILLHNATNGGERMLNVSKIRGRMAELHITQKDVAAELNLAQATVSQK